MKQLLCIRSLSLLGMFLVLSRSVVVAQDASGGHGNLIVNGTFEKGMEGWVVNANAAKGKASIDASEMRAGKATLRIENPEADDTHVKQKVKVRPGTRYRLSGYIKTKDVQPLKKGGKDGASLAEEGGFQKTTAIMGTKAWTKVSHDFDTGRETELEVGARLGFFSALVTGTAWFSDLSLVEVGKARN